jgi:hypothetical protein
LASQIAKKCGLTSYIERTNLTPEERVTLGKWALQDLSRLAVVLNSVWKVGNACFKLLIVDEAGLVRRHFVSRTLLRGTDAMDAYKSVRGLVNNADNVILLQEGLERGDVAFYMAMRGFDAEDRRYVTGYKLEKPVCVHDIMWSTDLYDILGRLLDDYAHMAAEAGEDGRLARPFVVLCSSLAFADALYDMIATLAVTDVQRSRIRLVTSRQGASPQDAFDRDFGEEPGIWGPLADVIICTSRVGAGFSIESHFIYFYAFYHNNILSHGEERQFLQRLRYWRGGENPVDQDADYEAACKQSYMWIEGGHSRSMCCDPTRVHMLYDLAASEVRVPGFGRQPHWRGGPLESTELTEEESKKEEKHAENMKCIGALQFVR